MANLKHVEIVKDGVDSVERFRRSEPETILDLTGADLTGLDLARCDLHAAILDNAELEGVDLRGAHLEGASLRHTNLKRADLTGAVGLHWECLGGADLGDAKMPGLSWSEVLQQRLRQDEGANYTRHLLWWLLTATCFCWLTIGSTRDVQLILSEGALKLPLFDVEIPVIGFYWMAPPLLLGAFLYFQIYLQRQWDLLGGLPAVFPDGEPIDRKMHGWIMLGLVRRHFYRLVDRPPLFRSQVALCAFLAWWLTPLTVIAFWLRYTHCHDMMGSSWHVVLAGLSTYFAMVSYVAAIGALRGKIHMFWRFSRLAIPFLVTVGLWSLTLVAVRGEFGGPLFNAGLTNEKISKPPANWTTVAADRRRDGVAEESGGGLATALVSYLGAGKEVDERGELTKYFLDSHKLYLSVIGVRLEDANLRGAQLRGAFLARGSLARADLSHASMWECDLSWCDLKDATLEHARLWHADLTAAKLTGASLANAQMSEAILVGANAAGCIFWEATLHNADLRGGNFTGARFSQAWLCGADLRGAVLSNASLLDAKLATADLRDATLSNAILVKADLSSADLRGAEMQDADLRDAILCGADLRGCKNLTEQMLKLAIVDENTKLGRLASMHVVGAKQPLIKVEQGNNLTNLQHQLIGSDSTVSPQSKPAKSWFEEPQKQAVLPAKKLILSKPGRSNERR